MRYGRFSKDGTEYIIERPDTPRPWFNKFGNMQYSLTISQAGGAWSISHLKDYRRPTWYIPRYDESGRYVYLRDAESGDVWGATYGPIYEAFDRFECRHGLGWTTFATEKHGIACEMTVFVPVDGPVEIWTITLSNRSDRPRRIAAFPFVEWTLDIDAQGIDDIAYAAHSDGEYDAAAHAVVASRREPWRFGFRRAFLMMDDRPSGWDANRSAFVGAGRTLRNPIVVERGRCTRTPAYAEISVAVLQKSLALAPGDTAAFHVMLGLADAPRERRALRKRWLAAGAPERELQRVRAFWDGMRDRIEIHTPDRMLDTYVNRWLVKHVHALGATMSVRGSGTGFRNFVQDGIGMLPVDPAASRRIILTAMKYQVSSGECFLWIYFDERPPRGPKHVDTKIWLTYLVPWYIRETGDLEILEHRERFYDSPESNTVLERLYLILDKSWRDRGKHGLSLVGEGDWNDNLSGMGKEGRGESMWMSMAVLWGLREVAELAERVGDRRRAALLRRRATILCDAINRYGWDGDRYIMGYNDAYVKVGSRKSPQVQVFLLPQVWAVLSGAAPPDRAAKLWHTVERELSGEYGVLLMNRPFTKADPSIGSVTFLAQGLNENGPYYSHGTAFKLCADGVSGRGDALYGDLLRLLPYTHDPAITCGEPFVISNYYRPPAVPRKHGATHRSWTTSTPSWTLRAVVEGMMGVRATYDGLLISPAIPAKWRRCSIRRRVRGDVYEVEIRNPNGVQSGVRELWIDGRRLDGNLIPYAGDGKTHRVRVVLG